MKVVLTHHLGATAVIEYVLDPGQTVRVVLDFDGSHRWYDFSIEVAGAERFGRRYAGRIENGELGLSDPAIGRVRVGETRAVVS